MTPKIDPEFEALIPPLSEDERAGLEESIKARGCRVPLDVWDGVLVDGHNRFKICTEHGIPFETKPIEFEDRRAARMWIIRNQFDRRNLDMLTRIELASIYEADERQAAKERMLAGVKANPPEKLPEGSEPRAQRETRDVIGKMAGVSGRTYERGKKVLEKAIPEIREAVKTGRVSVSAAAEIADLPEQRQREIASGPDELIRERFLDELRYNRHRIEKAPHVANNSGENEWYTPAPYIEAARAVMGSIDTDPASCEQANKTVQAATFYSKEDDGLAQPWTGNVWLNPPYAQPLIGEFAEAVTAKYAAAEIDQAIVLCNNATETAFFQRMMEEAAAICFPRARIRFIDKDGNPSGAPLQGQAVLYFGDDHKKFADTFAEFGKVVVRYGL